MVTTAGPRRTLSVPIAPGIILTAHQAGELARCAASFRYFLRYWLFVSRESGAVMSLGSLWEGQDVYCTAAREHDWLYMLKAGKLGFTELACAYDGWVLRFGRPNARVHVFSMRLDSAKDLRRYIKFGLDHLPDWMRLPLDEAPGSDTTTELRLHGGLDDLREAVCYPASANISIDQSASHSHIDELARMPFPRATWTAIESTIADVPDSTCHIVTRGAGAGNFSAELWMRALEGRSRLHPLFMPWDARAGRDEAWYEEQRGEHDEMGLHQFAPTTWEEAVAGVTTDTVVPYDWVQDALTRPKRAAGINSGAYAGLDVARFGSDMTAFVAHVDGDVFVLDEWRNADTMESADKVAELCRGLAVRALAIDDTGVGGGVTDRLGRMVADGGLDLALLPVNFGEGAQDKEHFHNAVSEVWWTMRDNFDPESPLPVVLRSGPLVYKLVGQTQARRYKHDRAGEGRIWVYRDEPEGEAAPSPDLADALALSLWAWNTYFSRVRGEAATTYHRKSWLGG